MANYGDLFREYHRQARKAAREEFARTPVGRLMRLGSGYKPAKEADVKRFLAAVRVQQFGLTPSLKGIRFRAVSYSIERYAKEDSPQGDLVRAWLESLGEAGQFLLEMFGSPTAPVRGMRGVADALESAMRLLRVFGYEVLPNPNRPMTPAAHARAVAAAWRFLRDTGELQAAEVFGDIRGLSRLTEDVFQPKMTVPDSGAATSPALPAPPELGNIPADHPLWSGEFVAVNQSSNVHSAAYDYREAALYVRFHEKEYNKDVGDWVPVGPGPIYAYYNVPPSMFLDLLETRSPGNWVWDHLRIRGTVSGHRFDYRLVAISGTYVPRKATFGPLKSKEYEGLYGEMFVPRIVPGPTGKWLQSLNPYEVVRVFEPQEPISPDQAVLFGL